MFKKIELVKTAYTKGDYPPILNAEIAFAGRSNVGKSSLLNKLFGIKIAKISSNPGKTRSINFYNVDNKGYLVDLPGYGFANVSKSEKKKWADLMEDYFKNRYSLQMVFLLIDHRHEPQKKDIEMIQWLKELEIPFMIVLTKLDKLKKNERVKQLNLIKSHLSKYGDYIYFPVSSKTGEGIGQLKNEIIKFLK
ncbi:GTP-binding protein [Marinitoga sp. 1135]|uniref:Probable GTP-binding protein EngB n=1 Tax=Marinitoga piezophila (strain DSM 14283 / JCM 11233 / KA3) TaxID=443254 RepID=H2J4B1_MARPK|nr:MULTISPECIES: ribosome biogenesis GTP-binding protein YihA/YsxC [Marinitoga]AEX85926.1 ribosome biogenesis GTP-binding protein YsxC/EngB [Marinitoga piezophila KA3]NUU96124.1 GTP-binding protein [Marinitoga sp. 1135]NUU98033.1 GTP-binding protein [Marinitoga sp. 1138]